MARERKFSTQLLFQTGKDLLLRHGYEGFTFGMLADRLKVARGTIYKYYENKEEFIMDYMVYEMRRFLKDLGDFGKSEGFEKQLRELLDIIHKHSNIHQILGMNQQIPAEAGDKVRSNKELLEKLHMEMYGRFQGFIQQGRDEDLLNPGLPDQLVLGMIFQTINIPNHEGLPKTEWLDAIQLMICHGIYKNN